MRSWAVPSAKTTTSAGGMLVATILAVGICIALNALIFAVVWDAVNSEGPGISENATQILTGWGGGILGVIGALVGYKAGENRRTEDEVVAKQAREEVRVTEGPIMRGPSSVG